MTETNATSDILGHQMAALTATKRCPKCDGLCAEMCKPPDASQGRPNGIPCRCVAFSDGCDGSGRVYVLDPPTPEHPQGEHELRMRCKCTTLLLCDWCVGETFAVPRNSKNIHRWECGSGCFNCQGHSWTPNKDGFAWMRAAEEAGIDLIYDSYTTEPQWTALWTREYDNETAHDIQAGGRTGFHLVIAEAVQALVTQEGE